MKKKNRVLAICAAIAVIFTMCISAAGCADLEGMMDAYQSASNTEPQETLAEGQSIYDLSMFQSLPASYSTIDPAFWVANGQNGGKVYFLGSIHCADSTSYRLPEHLINAYLESDALAVECDVVQYEQDIASNIMAQFTAAKDMMYMDGSTIADHLSPETYNGLVNLYNENLTSYASMGYNLQTLEKMKPALWMSLIENAQIEKAGLDSELGIDSHLLKIAHAQGKQIIEIESVEFQNDLLFGFSDDVNELLMASYAASPFDEQCQYLLDTYHAWQIGDLSVLLDEEEPSAEEYEGYTAEEIAEYERISAEYNDAMLYNRNIGMADKAQQMLDKGQNVFYVVGAAHMCGPKGIIELLRSRGYTVDQIGGLDAASKLGNTTTTAATTAQTAATTTANNFNTTTAQYNAVYESQYEVYEELYNYFGGTTRPADGSTTTAVNDDTQNTTKTSKTAKPTTAATNTGNQNNGNTWGGWGSSDGPAGGRGLIY